MSPAIEVGNTTAKYSIDVRRCHKCKDEPDGFWVCLVGPDPTELTDPDAKAGALNYVQERVRGAAPTGIDKTSGPFPDDGTVRPPTEANAGNSPSGGISAAEYLQMAAAQQMGQAAGKASRYVYYVRVRRVG